MSVSEITKTALYLTFKLEYETFAIDVTQVREILDLISITRVPRSPEYMKGVINVRGSVVPVIDLRTRFGMPQAIHTVDTRIIIMEISTEEKATILGAIADSVDDVLELEPTQIEKAPELGARWRSEFIKGIGKSEDSFIIILDISKVLSSDDLMVMHGKTNQQVLRQTKESAEKEAFPLAVGIETQEFEVDKLAAQ